MKVSKVNQYSVFLINEPGALEKFADLLCSAGLDISGLSSEVRYEAAVVKFVLSDGECGKHEVLNLMTRGGYTAVKTEAISLEVDSRPGIMAELGRVLSRNNININTIFGSSFADSPSRIYLVVDQIDKALKVLEREFASEGNKTLLNGKK